ncbi:hypothetical protein TWF694_008163 [Orbilia ellipsospora]|uniref:Acyl-protein thioesterase n=1 Tax=Orbilia ellipsospora TaxID=2528407 RepID=A0AAV9XF99_9PEZI
MANPFPSPFVVEAQTSHTHTAILLHGLGGHGEHFGTELIASATSSGQHRTLQEVFPGMKFLFPTSRRTRSTVFKRAKVNQWFDISSLDDRTHGEEVGIDGLAETSNYIRGLIQIEIENGIPAKCILLGGLSQGLAASLYTLLTLNPQLQIGAYIGMSGYFPFVKDIEKIIQGEEDDIGSDDIFGTEDDEADSTVAQQTKGETNLATQAVNFVRENIDLSPLEPSATLSCLDIPVFIGHGELDERVSLETGKRARDALQAMGMNVTWHQYANLGHWYKVPDEIDDIVEFIQQWLEF